MDNFEKYMNPPAETIPITDENILGEYSWRKDVGRVAGVFCIRRAEVNAVLRRAGIVIEKKKKENEE